MHIPCFALFVLRYNNPSFSLNTEIILTSRHPKKKEPKAERDLQLNYNELENGINLNIMIQLKLGQL